MYGSNSSLVHNTCSCMPLSLRWPARMSTERLLSKTLCFEDAEPNNNSKKATTPLSSKMVASAVPPAAAAPASNVVPEGSSHSGSSKKESKEKGERKSASPMGSGSESDAASIVSSRHVPPPGVPGMPMMPVQPGQPVPLGTMPAELSGSRQSFRMAMGNPSLIEAEDLE